MGEYQGYPSQNHQYQTERPDEDVQSEVWEMSQDQNYPKYGPRR